MTLCCVSLLKLAEICFSCKHFQGEIRFLRWRAAALREQKENFPKFFTVFADSETFSSYFLLVWMCLFYPAALQIPPTDAHCHKSVSVTHVRGKKTPK